MINVVCIFKLLIYVLAIFFFCIKCMNVHVKCKYNCTYLAIFFFFNLFVFSYFISSFFFQLLYKFFKNKIREHISYICYLILTVSGMSIFGDSFSFISSKK